jgi:hypothetical protein
MTREDFSNKSEAIIGVTEVEVETVSSVGITWSEKRACDRSGPPKMNLFREDISGPRPAFSVSRGGPKRT